MMAKEQEVSRSSEEDAGNAAILEEHASYYAPPGADHTLGPGDGRRGFLVGVAVAAVGLSALWWFFMPSERSARWLKAFK